jgi:PiT family inorganic phosphate transporter
MAAGLNFLGALISTHVATTIGKGIVDPAYVSQVIVLAALAGAIFWDLLTWHYGIPASSAHALIGGLIGAVLAARGADPLQWVGISKILVAIVLSPVTGTVASFFLMIAIIWVFRSCHPSPLNGPSGTSRSSRPRSWPSRTDPTTRRSRWASSPWRFTYGSLSTFHVPAWVILACAAAMAAGTAMGGWRIIKTVGKDFVELQPVHGFCAETSSAAVILTATGLGIPISTTHVITSAILGTGLSQGRRKVNWGVGIRIVWAWVLTIPASAAAGYFAYRILFPFLVKI